MRAAKRLLDAGAEVTLIDRSDMLGGQLTKQTHMFFGSEKQHASKRGIDIMQLMIDDIVNHPKLTVIKNATVVAMYKDRVVGYVIGETYHRIQANAIVVAAGASEKAIPFENNDLPGVYAAGAVQTLMNVYGVKPGHKVLMVGSGNIGLIVTYQLLQAGVEVVKLIEAADSIGGYLVHASKIKRLGVDIETNMSVKRAIGKDEVEAAEIWRLDEAWQGIEGTEEIIECDVICMAVGLAPLTELLQQMGAKIMYVRELGGNVPVIDKDHRTSIERVYACGDMAGIEEASSAMMAGEIAGLSAAVDLGYHVENYEDDVARLRHELSNLRDGPHGEKIRLGLKKLGVLS